MLDSAMLDIVSGAFDYNTVLMRTVKQLTNSGLRSVDYATGWSNRVDVAARRAVMTGMSQLTAKVNEDNMTALDTEYVEVSWHSGARPSHQEWQGKIYHWPRGKNVDKSGESGIIKKNKPLKISMQFFAKKSKDFSTIILPNDEYAHVMSEIATNISDLQKSKKVFIKAIGKYNYTVENNGFGNYRIIGKREVK